MLNKTKIEANKALNHILQAKEIMDQYRDLRLVSSGRIDISKPVWDDDQTKERFFNELYDAIRLVYGSFQQLEIEEKIKERWEQDRNAVDSQWRQIEGKWEGEE